MDKTTFQYLKPTNDQMVKMEFCRNSASDFEAVLQMHIPDGPDKTYLIRKLREVSMWANVAITRNPDGSPRS